jgi:hypothetical protein
VAYMCAFPLRISQFSQHRAIKKTYQYFNSKPRVTHTFDVKEEQVGIRLLLIDKPTWRWVCCLHSYILNYWHSHVRMCFQTKWYNRYANEKNRYDANYLKGKVCLLIKLFHVLAPLMLLIVAGERKYVFIPLQHYCCTAHRKATIFAVSHAATNWHVLSHTLLQSQIF